jgi:carotenoid cleavage dioxygenase
MKKLLQNSILGGFIPWIFFSLVYQPSSPTMILVSSIGSIILMGLLNFKEIQKGFVLPWGSLLFFAFSALNGAFGFWVWGETYAYLLVNSALAAIVLLSMVLGKPFTLQYAREQVDKSKWNHPIFIKINWILTGIWALLLIVMAIPSYVLTQEQIDSSWFWNYGLSILCIVVGLRCNKTLPQWLRKKL